MLTMQRILSRYLPDVLGISPEEIGADGSPFSRQRCMVQLESANKDLSHLGTIRQTRYLYSQFDFEKDPANNDYEYYVPYPANVETPVVLKAIQDNGRELATIWVSQTKSIPNAVNVTRPGVTGYRYENDRLMLLQPNYRKYRLLYYRSPGSLCYGNVEAVTDDAVTLSVPTAGYLANQTNAYVYDHLVFTKDGEADVISVVTEYDPATRIATLREAPGVDDTWEYSFVSFLPTSYQMALVYRAAMKFNVERPEGALNAAASYASIEESMLEFMKPDEATTPTIPVQAELSMAFGRSQTFGRINSPNSGYGY